MTDHEDNATGDGKQRTEEPQPDSRIGGTAEGDTAELPEPAPSGAGHTTASESLEQTSIDASVFIFWAQRCGLSELLSSETRQAICGELTTTELAERIAVDLTPAGGQAVIRRFLSQNRASGADEQVRLVFGQCLHLSPLKKGGLGETHAGCMLNQELLQRRAATLVDGLAGSLPPDESPAALKSFVTTQIQRVHQEKRGRVVIKTPRTDVGGDTASQLRHIRREARRWAATQGVQQYLVPVFDADVEETTAPYIAMEWVDGVDGNDLVKQSGGRLELGVAALAISQLFAATYGNACAGLIHGDIKPHNVMFEGGKLRLLDLGLAKFDDERLEESMLEMTGTGVVKGTLAFISPFRFGGTGSERHLDDLFAAAVSAHYWLTSTYPYLAGEGSTRLADTVSLRQRLLEGDGLQQFEYDASLFPGADQAATAFLADLTRVLSRLLDPRFLKEEVYGAGGEPFLQRYGAIVQWFQHRSPLRTVAFDDFAFGRFSPSQLRFGTGRVSGEVNHAHALAEAVLQIPDAAENDFLLPYRTGSYEDDTSGFAAELTAELPAEYARNPRLDATLAMSPETTGKAGQPGKRSQKSFVMTVVGLTVVSVAIFLLAVGGGAYLYTIVLLPHVGAPPAPAVKAAPVAGPAAKTKRQLIEDLLESGAVVVAGLEGTGEGTEQDYVIVREPAQIPKVPHQIITVDLTNGLKSGLHLLEGQPAADSVLSIVLKRKSLGKGDFLLLTKLPSLTHLILSYCRFHETDVAPLANLRTLREVDVGFSSAGDATVTALAKLPALRSFTAQGCTLLQPDSAGKLARNRQLTKLDVWRADPGDEAVLAFAGHPALQHLNVSGPGITDRCVPALLSLPKIEELHLHGTAMTQRGLVQVAGIKNLRWLGVTSPALDDEVCLQLSDHPSIERLELKEGQFSSQGIKALRGMTALQQLNLAGSLFAADTVKELLEFKQLKYVDVTGCKLSSGEVSTLRRALTGTTISADD